MTLLHVRQQIIETTQIHRSHGHGRHLDAARPRQQRLHRRQTERATLRAQPRQRRAHRVLALSSRQVQDPQVLSIRRRRIADHERIVGLAEVTRGKQLLAIAIMCKRSGFTHQPVDDVAILDVPLISSTQPRHVLHQLLGIPHLHVLGIETDHDPLADQPAWHRVVVPLDVDHTTWIDTRLQPTARVQPTRGQRTQQAQFFG
jgi:hypothetical protein